jgi:hypothetical protein
MERYQFVNDTLTELEKQKWVKIIRTTKVGSLTKPLTWFNPPIGSFHILMPSPFNYGIEADTNFLEVFIDYEEKERKRLIETNCEKSEIIYSEPKNGTYKYTSNEFLKMTEYEKSLLCNYNWSKEREELRNFFFTKK